MCFLSILYHFINKLFIGDAGIFPQIESKASRNGIDFCDKQISVVSVYHIIDSDYSFAVQKPEYFFAHFLYLFLQLRFNRCGKDPPQARHSLGTAGCQIFIFKVKKFIIIDRHFNG